MMSGATAGTEGKGVSCGSSYEDRWLNRRGLRPTEVRGNWAQSPNGGQGKRVGQSQRADCAEECQSYNNNRTEEGASVCPL